MALEFGKFEELSTGLPISYSESCVGVMNMLIFWICALLVLMLCPSIELLVAVELFPSFVSYCGLKLL